MNLKWACFDSVSILHLKANYLNLEGGNELEGTELQEPLSFSEEYLRLKRMSCRSINELFAYIDEAKRTFSYRVYYYDNLKLGQNCESFLDELVAMYKL
ncbi:hypothetical protein ChTU502y2012_408g0130 [Cryptosporidium hominis]|nr:hypothetical protein ChTU502y2012_408g0130 [Cryptosporidium hominis]